MYQIDIPLKVSIGVCLCIWVYILNITNFTDGSDGFLATNSIFVFFNIIFINYFNELNIFSKYLGILILPSLLIFLYFNRPTAKMYLGDSGSILIGYLNGFLFLELLVTSNLNLAISLLIYPILDCSVALIKKLFQVNFLGLTHQIIVFYNQQLKETKINILYFILIFSLIY